MGHDRLPAALIVIFLVPLFVPNALSALPEWGGPAIVAVAPFMLGLISGGCGRAEVLQAPWRSREVMTQPGCLLLW